MGSGLFFPISAFFVSVLILFMFFNKKHLNNIETKLYRWLIVTNFFGLILEFCCTFAAYISEKMVLLSNIIFKLYLVYVITWAIIFAIYIFVISHEKEYMLKIKNKAQKIVKICYWISVIIIFSLPIKLIIKNNFAIRYTKGPSVTFTYALSSLIIIIMLYCMIKNIKNLKSKKYLPLFVFLVVGAGAMYFQMLNPDLLLITSVETYIILLMYFTIENPDLKMIEEIIKNKSIADNSNENKTLFIYNIVQNLRKPLENIRRIINNYNLKYVNVKDCLKEVIAETKKADLLINDTLDISNLTSERIPIYDDNYSVKLLIKELQIKYNNIISKEVKFIVNASNDIPDYLYGNGVRLKQIINAVLSNSVKFTKKGFIDFTIYPIIKGDICRLLITIEDSGIGMSLEKTSNIFEANNLINIDNVELDKSDAKLPIIKK